MGHVVEEPVDESSAPEETLRLVLLSGCQEPMAILPVCFEIVVFAAGEPVLDVGNVDFGMELCARHPAECEELGTDAGPREHLGTRRWRESVVVPLHPGTGADGVPGSVSRVDFVPSELGLG